MDVERWEGDESGDLQPVRFQPRELVCECGGTIEYLQETQDPGEKVRPRSRFPHACGAMLMFVTVTDLVVVPSLKTPSEREVMLPTDPPKTGTLDSSGARQDPGERPPDQKFAGKRQGPLHPERTRGRMPEWPHRHNDASTQFQHSHVDGWVEHEHDQPGPTSPRTTGWTAITFTTGQLAEYERLAAERSTPHPEAVPPATQPGDPDDDRPFPRGIEISVHLEGSPTEPIRQMFPRKWLDAPPILAGYIRDLVARQENQ